MAPQPPKKNSGREYGTGENMLMRARPFKRLPTKHNSGNRRAVWLLRQTSSPNTSAQDGGPPLTRVSAPDHLAV